MHRAQSGRLEGRPAPSSVPLQCVAAESHQRGSEFLPRPWKNLVALETRGVGGFPLPLAPAWHSPPLLWLLVNKEEQHPLTELLFKKSASRRRAARWLDEAGEAGQVAVTKVTGTHKSLRRSLSSLSRPASGWGCCISKASGSLLLLSRSKCYPFACLSLPPMVAAPPLSPSLPLLNSSSPTQDDLILVIIYWRPFYTAFLPMHSRQFTVKNGLIISHVLRTAHGVEGGFVI